MIHVPLLEGVTHYAENLAVRLISGYVHRQLVEGRAMHVRFEQFGELGAVSFAAQQPGHEVHADHDAIERVA